MTRKNNYMSKDDFRNLHSKEICKNKCKQNAQVLWRAPQRGIEENFAHSTRPVGQS